MTGRSLALTLVAAMALLAAPMALAQSTWWDDGSWDNSVPRDAFWDDVRSGYGNTGTYPSSRNTATAPASSSGSSGSGAASAFRQTGAIPENTRPWSGAWFPRSSCELAFKSFSQGLSPFEKYDTIVLNLYGRVPGAAVWEADPNHAHNNAPYSNRPNWAGHCNGLAAAAILAPEPRQAIRVSLGNGQGMAAKLNVGSASSAAAGCYDDGRYDYVHQSAGLREVELTVADQKGWLAEIYMTCQTRQFSNRDLLGHRYDGQGRDLNDPNYRDIYPHYFHYLLQEFVKKQNQAVVAEVDPHLPVNNHPLWGFDTQGSFDANRRAYRFTTKIYMTDYASSAGSVGTKVLSRTYTYDLLLDSQGRVYGGEWTGSSVHAHPDFIWIPTANAGAYKNYENPCLNAGFINYLFTKDGNRQALR